MTTVAGKVTLRRYAERRELRKSEESSVGRVYVGGVHSGRKSGKPKMIEMSTTLGSINQEVQWRPDTGTGVNVLAEKDYRRFGKRKAIPTRLRLVGADGSSLECMGKVPVEMELRGNVYQDVAYILKDAPESLLCYDGIDRLEAWDKMMSDYDPPDDDSEGGVEDEVADVKAVIMSEQQESPKAAEIKMKKARRKFPAGTVVRVKHRTTGRWNLKGVVTDTPLQGSTNYGIKSKEGKMFWRDEKYLKESKRL